MPDDVRDILGGEVATAEWLAHLTALPAPTPAPLPARDELAPILLDLAIPHEDIDPLVALLSSVESDPGLRWVLDRAVFDLVSTMGTIEAPPDFPVLPERLGAVGRFFFVFVFVAALPAVRAYHASRDVPDEVSRRTLADLGRNLAVHRRRTGGGGLGVPYWLMRHFRGTIYALGRLQFERTLIRAGSQTSGSIRAAGLSRGGDDFALSVHIPDFSGPMSPGACDASFAAAADFFPRHFPEEPYGLAACYSWLLDPQLAEYLPAQSNIVRFQARFTHSHPTGEPDGDTCEFVFGQRTPDLDGLPQDTTLQRAIVAHLRAGRHWNACAGWCVLDRPEG